MGAFHAYDIRGIYGKDWDRETAYKIGYFIYICSHFNFPFIYSTYRVFPSYTKSTCQILIHHFL